MIIHDFNSESVVIFPFKTEAPADIDPYAELPRSPSGEFLQVVGRRYPQVPQGFRCIKHQQFSPCRALEIRRQSAGGKPLEKALRFRIRKALYHRSYNNVQRSSCQAL